jgi:hypothetical protein
MTTPPLDVQSANEDILQDVPESPVNEFAVVPFDFAQESERQQLAPTFSIDIEERQPMMSHEAEGGMTLSGNDLEADLGIADLQNNDAQRAMAAIYGDEFPLVAADSPTEENWVQWPKALWARHRAGVETRLHFVERNRLMRKGIQWISAQGLGPWREPPKPKDATRAVDNVIQPALDQRLQIVSEQRPGFRARPESQDQRSLKKAEAQQIALEYQYTQQGMGPLTREACYWNGTDGVSFWHLFWNPERGPWDEVYVPTEGGEEGEVGLQHGPMGDIETEVLRVEEVRVSPDATATKKPHYWVIRKVIPTQQAVAQYGIGVIDADVLKDYNLSSDSGMSNRISFASTLPDALYRDLPTVDRYTVYCEKSEYMKEGCTVVVVGNKLVAGPMPLMYGVVPLVRVTDGSTDPNFYPEAVMEGWVDSQMRINVLKSKWIDSIRVNSGGRILAKENSVAGETLIGGMTSLVSIKGPGALRDSVEAMQGFSVGEDVKELLEIERKAFEDRSGWNDTSRGSFSSDQSGRAILAIREQLERTFAPCVNAVSEAMVKWAEITLTIMRWGYDYPRVLSVEGTGRPDLARAIGADDLDGVANITIDPETLMPMPRALRLFLLDSMLQKGAMSMDEYKRRLPFAFTRDLGSPDTDQSARAMRVVQAIKETANPQALPMLWQDNEAIHQDILERELILPDELPFEHPVRQAAIARWQMLAQQSQMKMGGMPQGAPPANSGGAPGGEPPKLSPTEQPFQGTNPGVAAGSAAEMAGNDSVAASFEGALPQ